MAQDVGYDFDTGPTVTLISSDVTTGSASALTATVDFGTPTPVAFGYEWILTTLASADGPVSLEVAWSHDNSDFSDTNNVELVDVMTVAASTDNKKCNSAAIKARYGKFRIKNDSGGSVDGTASNSALVLFDVFYDYA